MKQQYEFDIDLRIHAHITAESYDEALEIIRTRIPSRRLAITMENGAVISGDTRSVKSHAITCINAQPVTPIYYEPVGRGLRYALSKRYFGYCLVRLDDGAVAAYDDAHKASVTRILNLDSKDISAAVDAVGLWAERHNHFTRGPNSE